MRYIKYILLIVQCLICIASFFGLDTIKQQIYTLKSIPEHMRKHVYHALISVLIIALISFTIIDDYSANKEQGSLHHKLSLQSVKLEQQKLMIAQQSEALDYQRKLALEQEMSLGSVVYSTATSFEGKERFLRNFDELARIAGFKTNSIGFEGLICDDGVALYWFNAKTETIMGFHFFTNAEINNVLRGIPFWDSAIADVGALSVSQRTELSMAFKDCLLKEMPPIANNALDAERAEKQILAEIETILRYVYRAEDVVFLEESPHTYSLLFRYAVNPFASPIRYRSLMRGDAMISDAFINSLHGLTKDRFSEKVIEKFRNDQLEPKIRTKDIRILRQARKVKEWRDNSPFSLEKAVPERGGIRL